MHWGGGDDGRRRTYGICFDDYWEDHIWVWECHHIHQRSNVSEVRSGSLQRICTKLILGSEIAPAKKRGSLVVMNHIGMVSGLAVAFWYVLS